MIKPSLAILFTLLMLAGCGQKGPLYLEKANSTASTAGESDAAQEEESEAESTTE